MAWIDSYPPGRKIPVRRGPFSYNNQVRQQENPGWEQPAPAPEPPAPTLAQPVDEPAPSDGTDWRERAMRLQAEMDNFRKRQSRRADEAIAAERERLLRLILPIADNLARALNHAGAEENSLHQGVELTQRELSRLLETEGVTRLETLGQPFDPAQHEAVATRPDQAEPGTIIAEIEAGYKLGDKLLRPARVVVAA